jgi:uncharacterized membrane protein YtjA (UPF0391 family)
VIRTIGHAIGKNEVQVWQIMLVIAVIAGLFGKIGVIGAAGILAAVSFAILPTLLARLGRRLRAEA